MESEDVEFDRIVNGMRALRFPDAAGDRLPGVSDFPGQVVEAFTFGGIEGVMVLMEGVARARAGQEVEYMALCRASTADGAAPDPSGESSAPGLKLDECRILYSQPAAKALDPQYAIALQRMEIEVMRRLAAEGFRILSSETGSLPPGVPDEWLHLSFLEGFESSWKEANLALSAGPDDAALHYEKGALLLARGRYRESLSSFIVALRLEPTMADGWRGLADSLLRMGRGEEREARRLASAIEIRRQAELAGGRESKADTHLSKSLPPAEMETADHLLGLARELSPLPLREPRCPSCSAERGEWLDGELLRCGACGKVTLAGLSP